MAEAEAVAATPAAAPALEAAIEAPEIDTVDTRAEALIKSLKKEKATAKPEPEPEPEAKASEKEDAQAEEKIAPAPAKDERAEALKRAADLEKKAHFANQRMLEREAKAVAHETQLKEYHSKLEAKERELAQRMKAFEDPVALLELLSEKVPAQQLSSWLHEAQKPEKRIEWEMKRQKEAINPELAELKAELARMRQEQQSERQGVARRQAESGAIDHVKAAATTYPYAANLASTKPQMFVQMLHNAADYLRSQGESVDYDSCARYINEDLSGYAPVFASQKADAAAPSETPVTAPASKARTLSSRNSAGRSTLVNNENDLAPLDDRVADLKRRIARGEAL